LGNDGALNPQLLMLPHQDIAMEHRLSQRTKGRLPLLVYRKGLPVAIGQVHNASRVGLYVATDYTDVGLNQKLELEFGYPGNNDHQRRRLKVHVVRKDNKGLGLDFSGLDNDTFTIVSLIDWLRMHPLSFSSEALRQQAQARGAAFNYG
jgi:hypothetical protein